MWARAGLEPAPTGEVEGYPIKMTWEIIETRVAEDGDTYGVIGGNPKPATGANLGGSPYGVD